MMCRFRPMYFLRAAAGRRFVDYEEDLQLSDLDCAVAEGFDDIQLLKRYTTAGMGPGAGEVGECFGCSPPGGDDALPALFRRSNHRPPSGRRRNAGAVGRRTGGGQANANARIALAFVGDNDERRGVAASGVLHLARKGGANSARKRRGD